MRKLLHLSTCALLLAGCAYSGGDITNPIGRKFTWFSFVEGGDLRAACIAGAPDRYRMVYNGVYGEQVRVYELGGAQGANRLFQHVFGDVDLLAGLSLSDPTGPWRGQGVTLALSPEQREALVSALDRDGAFDTPAVGLELPSRSYYWAVAACHQGRYHFNAWRWPSPRFDRLGFGELLFALDRTGVPVAPPGPVPDRYHDTDFHGDFNLRVGERGLWGTAEL